MRTSIILLFWSGMALQAMSQSPDRLSYQAIVRNASGNLVANQSVGMRITILKGSATGSAVYVETQTRTTNANGLVTLEIGGGTATTGNFSTVNWGQGPYFIKTETDVAGGTNYLLTGTTQLLSVPYSLYANDVSTSLSNVGDTLTIGRRRYIISGVRDVTAANGTFTCGSPISFDYGGVTVTYGTVEKDYGGTIGKRCWLDRNLGAVRVAVSATDFLAYGDLFQCGRGPDGHQVMTWTSVNSGVGRPVISTTSSIDNPGHSNWINDPSYSLMDWRIPQNNNLWQGVTGINNPCPSGWRLPTETEWIAERASWTGPNASGAFSSTLKLPLTGGRAGAGNFFPTAPPGSQGPYWTSNSFDIYWKAIIILGGSANIITAAQRHDGFSVRCIRE